MARRGERRDSFNHYSYGAVVGWLMDSAAGIRVRNGEIVLCPMPDRRLGCIDVTYESPMGRIRSAWKYVGDEIRYHVEIPGNTTATLRIPGQKAKELKPGIYQWS